MDRLRELVDISEPLVKQQGPQVSLWMGLFSFSLEDGQLRFVWTTWWTSSRKAARELRGRRCRKRPRTN